jgi:type I restriction enzyme S subunit
VYLAFWSQSRHYLDQVAVGAVKSTIENYSAAKYRATRVPLPKLVDQQRISSYLEEQTSKIDALIAETERFVELSKERRSALITAAVTGQIDVREMV